MTLTEDIRAIVERVKNLGPEWRHTANVLTDALGAAEHAQNARLRYLTTCIDEAKGRLAYHKQEIRTLPEQIAKWEAERARLESQTGLDLLRAVVAERGEKPAESTPPADPFVPGLPPLRLREVWAEWEDTDGDVVTFIGEYFRWSTWEADTDNADLGKWCDNHRSYRPHGKTRAEVEAMADEAEKRLPVATPQPKGGRAVVTFGGLPYYADSVKFDDAGKLVKGEGVPFGLPPSPALLDLRGLKVGDEVQLMEACHTLGGYRLVVGQKVRIAGVSIAEKDGSTWTVTPCVPARVVEVPR